MFRSFFLAGFEGSTGYNRHGEWFDQVVATGHEKTVEQDYRDLSELGIHGARETVRWPLVDLGRGRYDFSSVDAFAAAARRYGVEVVWDLFHYGYPPDLDLFGYAFPKRFADYCYAFGRHIAAQSEGICYFTPVNEPSFFAFAGSEAGMFAPHVKGRGPELKVALCRAAIAGIEALWSAAPDCRIVNVDPICRVVQPPGRPELAERVRQFNERWVFEAWDMLAGRMLPELGGSRAHLDIVGINYYWTNQWELDAEPLPDGRIPPLADDDPRRVPLGDLIRTVWQRYGGELIVSETAHVGESRAPWLLEVTEEAERLLHEGVPLRGVCLYPILGMPEWHEPDSWTPMGLWDPVCHRERLTERLVCEPMLEALQSARHIEELHHDALAGSAPERSRSRHRPQVGASAGNPHATVPAAQPRLDRPRTRLTGPDYRQIIPGGGRY